MPCTSGRSVSNIQLMGFRVELKCNEKRKQDDQMQPDEETANDQDVKEEAQAAAMEEISKLNKLTTSN